ncbi:L-glutamine:scyllo-inosose aminotransferase/L-glutamine:2-deoxy-scyllo-inosose/3-amino-2,3-dideoxy-scyllo-inosose aminotransferase [Erwinia toletana]|uniref:L-glutamine:scyllo-inosose aminotransferase/L-glutamine:2-deoxy-scyllo-inosose/3-amino-2,3-dideoxy-scyllo-inosose aminotransferase n=1 Tax=Winslowiella toletana TaxID=92490 RepID=A0ABS4P410_9GAMM|nr:DegT/DnrJ/EryC1/StrS family aminotransferase [Winslowiella toletana]MBP2167389.1 L-glutamine:scyllo-inosose aminotransferase/L-glutamine:2-deoxy-scyllo-inosose/3-amino-2,3-dideoxy-scyllo-inosose aminotransferase [Winslowiella toletana]
MNTSELAINGGNAVRTSPWPTWPVATKHTMTNLEAVMSSGRWAISGCYTGARGYEQRFCQAFADYQGSSYAVATTNGSAAIKIALMAVGVGPGTEVIVPGLTWVACAAMVFELGAVPVLVDIDPHSLSISVQAAESALSDKTVAVLVVHAYCSAADMDGFVELANRAGIALVEDCSQAHGAEWRGQKLGSLGQFGVFSLQQTKVLTCGEGGVVTCSAADAYRRLQQHRANGRIYTTHPLAGQLELIDVGEVYGTNHAMSEIHAAIALAQLELLDEQNTVREANALYLTHALEKIPGVNTIIPPAGLTRRTYYDYVIQLNADITGPFLIHRVVEAMAAELGTFIETLDAPMNANILYNPLLAKTVNTQELIRQLEPKRFNLPFAHQAYNCSFAFLHHLLLGTTKDMDDIINAMLKVLRCMDKLRG